MSEEAKHTPAPWRISGFEVNTKSENRMVMGADGFAVCYVDGRGTEENAANARLITAAPVLLVALQRIVENCRDADCGDHCRNSCMFCRARAAIAKAIGGTK